METTFCGLVIDALIESHENPSQFLNVPAFEQLKPTAAATDQPTVLQPTPADALYEDEDCDGEQMVEPDLSFLSPTSKPNLIGTLGHYQILQVLGQGAFGIVFKAFDEKLHRLVAIKVLNPQMAVTSPPRKRFLREARSAAAIRHENIVQVYSVEEHPLPYLVMEYIDGQTLQQKLDGTGPLVLPEILQIGRQLAAGLAVAHAKGLIHRDIKPGNILLENGAELRVKITDFGLARAADDASLTRTGLISGTPMYMAPEQANGMALDHRSDLFSLGSVLYVMASGRPPFRADKPIAVLKRVTDESPRPIQEIIPEVPDWLCEMIGKLHSKKREDRFQSAQEVVDLLTSCQSQLQQDFHIDLRDVSPIASAVSNANKTRAPAKESTRHPAGAALDNRGSGGQRWVAVAGILLVLFVVLGLTEATGVTNVQGTVIRLLSPAGTLVVEVDDPSLSVSTDGKEMVITATGAKEFRLKPGQYKVLASKNGKPVHQELVAVNKNGRHVVRVAREAAWDATHSDRKAAEYVLAIGGKVRLQGVDREISSVADLPSEQFILTAILLGGNQQVTDAGLATCAGCKNLAQLDLVNTKITDAGLIHFAANKNLDRLYLAQTTVTDRGLAHFQGNTKLTELWLGNTQLTDQGMVYFKDCKDLTMLWVGGTSLTDKGVAHFQGCKNLLNFSVMNTWVTDRGLAHFQDCMKLQILWLGGLEMTDTGLACFKECQHLTEVYLDGTNVSDLGLGHLKNSKNLTTLSLTRTSVSDKGLSHLQDCQNLTYLYLQKSKLTAAGIATLKKSLPTCSIEWDGDVAQPSELIAP